MGNRFTFGVIAAVTGGALIGSGAQDMMSHASEKKQKLTAEEQLIKELSDALKVLKGSEDEAK